MSKYIPDIVEGWYYEVSDRDYEKFQQFLSHLIMQSDPLTVRKVRLDGYVAAYNRAIDDCLEVWYNPPDDDTVRFEKELKDLKI